MVDTVRERRRDFYRLRDPALVRAVQNGSADTTDGTDISATTTL